MPVVNKQILYIAYHYPPIVGSSGVHRTLAFTRLLSEQGWNVTVLTASLCAYARWSEQQKDFIPEKVNVIRAFARSTEKHFAIKGRYLRFMALPDNFQSWIVGAVIAGLKQIYKTRPQVIVSTYPIASAHIIGYLLHKMTGIPWVADFRDPMAQDGYPADRLTHRLFRWIENKAVKHCAKIVFTTDGAKKFYQDKFPDTDPALFDVIPNGYDAEIFDTVKRTAETKDISAPITLLHSGIIYPSERDPRQFFKALSELKAEGCLSSSTFLLRLRATGHDRLITQWLKECGIEDLVELAEGIPYKMALTEILNSDSLLLLQASNCNEQIPAKVYEYIKANRPMLALTDPRGDTGKLLTGIGVKHIANLDDKEAIKIALQDFLKTVINRHYQAIPDEIVVQFSRQAQSGKLLAILDKAIAP